MKFACTIFAAMLSGCAGCEETKTDRTTQPPAASVEGQAEQRGVMPGTSSFTKPIPVVRDR